MAREQGRQCSGEGGEGKQQLEMAYVIKTFHLPITPTILDSLLAEVRLLHKLVTEFHNETVP